MNIKGLEILRNLVDINDEDISKIIRNINDNPTAIQLLDYIEYMIGDSEHIKQIRDKQNQKIPEERKPYFEKYRKLILSLRTVNHPLSLLRLNPHTEFENHPPLFFGMGGGSKALCKGLPFDVLSMLLTAEKMRRELELGECRILLANRITYTNIPKNSEFSEEKIDAVMLAEKEILKLVTKKFSMSEGWNIFLQSDIESIIGKETKEGYEKLIRKADETSFVGGHHYSIEMADIWSLVNQEKGGIKLGWFIRNLDKKNGGYIMDEQPFHARYNLFTALNNINNKVTLSYANAGARLYSGVNGELEKESPYICYQKENRLLLSPFEDPIKKLYEASLSGGGLKSKYYRNLIQGIIMLFEELVLGKDEHGKIVRIPIDSNGKEADDYDIYKKISYIYDWIFRGEKEIMDIWKKGFND
ncbi:MAG: hypothetical protein PHS92_05015 [Candidatus Gracilibacteria bacterium]|nr:hypothetical protein [Candidatus Gracilibacteria bacterium]